MTCVADDAVGTAVDPLTDFAELIDSIDLPPGYRAEIINGSIVVSPTPTYDHAEIVTLVQEMLLTGKPSDLRALQVVTVEIAETGERYVPDLAVFPRGVLRGGKRREPSWLRPAEEAELVVEVVSPNNSARDRVDKVKGYAKAAVPLYLMIDPLQRRTVLFAKPLRGGYAEHHAVDFGGIITLPEPFEVEIDTGVFDLDAAED